jgi:hypothetical protein
MAAAVQCSLVACSFLLYRLTSADCFKQAIIFLFPRPIELLLLCAVLGRDFQKAIATAKGPKPT